MHFLQHSSERPDAMSVMSLLVVWHNASLQNPCHRVLRITDIIHIYITDIVHDCITARLQLVPVP